MAEKVRFFLFWKEILVTALLFVAQIINAIAHINRNVKEFTLESMCIRVRALLIFRHLALYRLAKSRNSTKPV